MKCIPYYRSSVTTGERLPFLCTTDVCLSVDPAVGPSLSLPKWSAEARHLKVGK